MCVCVCVCVNVESTSLLLCWSVAFNKQKTWQSFFGFFMLIVTFQLAEAVRMISSPEPSIKTGDLGLSESKCGQ